MQIVITVGEEERASARVLGAAPTGEVRTHAVAAQGETIDAGAAPAVAEDIAGAPVVSAVRLDSEAVEGGAAPAEAQATTNSPVRGLPTVQGAAEAAGPAPTISDDFPTAPGSPRLRPVN